MPVMAATSSTHNAHEPMNAAAAWGPARERKSNGVAVIVTVVVMAVVTEIVIAVVTVVDARRSMV